MEFGAIAIGFVGLWFGSSLTVRRIDEIARALGASLFALGTTVVAISTDLPELVVSISVATRATLEHNVTDLVTGTAVGSSIAQISLVLGISGLASAPKVRLAALRPHAAALGLAMLGFSLAAADGLIVRVEGVVLLIGYGTYVYLATTKPKQPREPQQLQRGTARTLLEFIGGVALVLICSELIVDSALVLAAHLPLGRTEVGALIVGVGTSLPELAVSLRAALQGKAGLSLGNVIGSNTFDLAVPAGVAALIIPTAADPGLLKIDMPVLCAATLLAGTLVTPRPQNKRLILICLLALYAGYVLTKSGVIAL